MFDFLRIQWLLFIPEIYLTIGILSMIVYGVSLKSISLKIFNGLTILILSGVLLLYTNYLPLNFELQFKLDNFANLANFLLIGFSILYIFSILPLLKNDMRYTYEYLILILTSILGMLLLIKANDLIGLYLSIELQSMGMYVLAAFNKTSKYGTEGGLKYYVMGSFASAILLLGIAFIYGFYGTTNFNDLILFSDQLNFEIIGYILILSGLLFKLGAVPFHMWAPDIYQAAPLATTTFFSIVPKLSLIIAIIHILQLISINNFPLNSFFHNIALLSILIGTLQALNQSNIKRLLSYSSINHIGFILMGLIPILMNYKVSLFYVIIYVLMTIGIFSILIELKLKNKNEPYFNISSLKLIGFTQPLLAFAFTLILFSMAGIPPLIGFYSKFYILKLALQSQFYFLSFVAILGSALAAVYYIKLIQYFYFYPAILTKEYSTIASFSKSNSLLISCIIIFISFTFLFQSSFLLYIQSF